MLFRSEDAKAEAWLDKVPLGELVPGSKCTFFAPSSSRLTLDDMREEVGLSLKIVRGSMGLEAPTNSEGMTPGVNKGMGLK